MHVDPSEKVIVIVLPSFIAGGKLLPVIVSRAPPYGFRFEFGETVKEDIDTVFVVAVDK